MAGCAPLKFHRDVGHRLHNGPLYRPGGRYREGCTLRKEGVSLSLAAVLDGRSSLQECILITQNRMYKDNASTTPAVTTTDSVTGTTVQSRYVYRSSNTIWFDNQTVHTHRSHLSELLITLFFLTVAHPAACGPGHLAALPATSTS